MRSCPIVTAIYIHTAEGNVAVLLRWRGSLCAKFTDEDGLILTIVSPWRNGFDTWTLMPVLNLQGGNQWTSSNCALCKWMNQWEMCVKNHQLDITWCNDETVFFILFLYNFEFRFGTAHHLLSEKDISHTFSRLKLPGTRLFTTQSEYAWFSGLHWDTPSVISAEIRKQA